MNELAKPFARATGINFGVFFVIAFTPLWVIPAFAQELMFDGGTGFIVALVILGMPFGGYLFYAIFHAFTAQKDKLFEGWASLTGFWVGMIGGTFCGNKITGVF